MNISEFLNSINSVTTTKFKISKNSGIEINQLRKAENKFAINLPNDLIEFYTSSNGLRGDDFIFNIIPLEEIEKDKDDLGTYLVFSEYLIYSETCGLEIDKIDKNKYRFFNTSLYPIQNGIINRKYVANSIVDFINLYCKKGTFGIWRDGNGNDDDKNNNEEAISLDGIIEPKDSEMLHTKKPWWKFW